AATSCRSSRRSPRAPVKPCSTSSPGSASRRSPRRSAPATAARRSEARAAGFEQPGHVRGPPIDVVEPADNSAVRSVARALYLSMTYRSATAKSMIYQIIPALIVAALLISPSARAEVDDEDADLDRAVVALFGEGVVRRADAK